MISRHSLKCSTSDCLSLIESTLTLKGSVGIEEAIVRPVGVKMDFKKKKEVLKPQDDELRLLLRSHWLLFSVFFKMLH